MIVTSCFMHVFTRHYVKVRVCSRACSTYSYKPLDLYITYIYIQRDCNGCTQVHPLSWIHVHADWKSNPMIFGKTLRNPSRGCMRKLKSASWVTSNARIEACRRGQMLKDQSVMSNKWYETYTHKYDESLHIMCTPKRFCYATDTKQKSHPHPLNRSLMELHNQHE